MSLKMFDGNYVHHELLLTTRQRTKLRNAFDSNMSTDIKLSKAQSSRINQSGRFSGSLWSNLAGPLMKVTVSLAKNTLAPVGINTAVQQLMQEFKKINTMFWSSFWFWFTNNYFNNLKDEINDIMKIVQALEDSNILLKWITKTIKN